MDPDTCLKEMLVAFSDSQNTLALEYLDNLSRWLHSGGYSPTVVLQSDDDDDSIFYIGY